MDLSADTKTTTVNIGYFDNSGTIHELKVLKMKTDRSILTDSGQSFGISKRSLRKKRDLSELDDDAADSASKADKGTSVDKQLDKDSDTAPIKFEILYDGAAHRPPRTEAVRASYGSSRRRAAKRWPSS